MKALLRDLGQMEYETCWKLQQELFDALLARKRSGSRDFGIRTEAKAVKADEVAVGEKAAGEKAAGQVTVKESAAGERTAGEKTAGEKTAERIAEGKVAAERVGHAGRMATVEETTATERMSAGENSVGGVVAGEMAAVKETTATEKTAAESVPGEKNTAERSFASTLPADCIRLADPHDRELVGDVLLVEHPPVYTLGKSGHAENLLVSRDALEAAGAKFFHIDRGGDITFHGPGQLVCYPILDLECLGIGLRDYIQALEEAVIRTVAQFGISAGRIPGASGVWIDPENRRPRKICAIGVRSSRYVTMHGFALNVTTDLSWFSRINPCGFTDRGVASIAAETGTTPSMEEVKRLVVKFLSDELNVEIYK